MIKRLGPWILAISIPVFVLLTSVEIAVSCDLFFRRHYEANYVDDITGIEVDELMRITDEIQDYLLGDRGDFLIDGIVRGEERQVFNEREIIHMEDVKVLFDRGIVIRNSLGVLAAVLSAYYFLKDRKLLYRSIKYSSIGFVSISTILAFMLQSDFGKYFTLFHEIFFDNDYWILDPRDSILINMVNIKFFTNIVILIVGLSTAVMICMGIFGYVKTKKEGHYER